MYKKNNDSAFAIDNYTQTYNKIDKISVKHYAKLCSYTFYIITNHK